MYHVFENSSDVVSGTKYAGVKMILLINEDYKQVRWPISRVHCDENMQLRL